MKQFGRRIAQGLAAVSGWLLLARDDARTRCLRLGGAAPLHEELSVDPEALWYVGTPDQTQVLHDELWLLAGELTPSSSAALVEAWYGSGRSALLPVECTGELVSSRHLAA
jgi:hypothetical protein